MATAVPRDDFDYGWGSTQKTAESTAGGGGVSGSQVGAQADGQGTLTPLNFNQPAPEYTKQPSQDAGFTSPWGNTGISGGMYDINREPQQQATPTPTAPVDRAGATSTPDFGSLVNRVNAASNPQDAAVAQDKLSRDLYSSLSSAGHDVKWGPDGSLMVDGRAYTVAGSGGGAIPTFGQAVSDIGGLGQMPSDLAGWRPTTAPLYTPGEIGFGDIPGFDYSSLMGELQNGQLGASNRALIQGIQDNPSMLSPQVVDTMKAQLKDTLAGQQQQEEEDLKGFGAQSGISDSRWLAGERGRSRRGRDIAIAQGNQNIDIEAAKTRQADRLAAGQLGLQAGSQKTAQVQAAASASLQKAGETGDRMQLRESVKQAAGQMKLSQDQVMHNFIAEKEKNLLQKYGIDLGARIDLAKLSEQSREFQEDLLFKMSSLDKQLAQSSSQFGAGLDFQYAGLNEKIDQDNWQRYLDIIDRQKPTNA